jgi:hypothetical protein
MQHVCTAPAPLLGGCWLNACPQEGSLVPITCSTYMQPLHSSQQAPHHTLTAALTAWQTCIAAKQTAPASAAQQPPGIAGPVPLPAAPPAHATGPAPAAAPAAAPLLLPPPPADALPAAAGRLHGVSSGCGGRGPPCRVPPLQLPVQPLPVAAAMLPPPANGQPSTSCLDIHHRSVLDAYCAALCFSRGSTWHHAGLTRMRAGTGSQSQQLLVGCSWMVAMYQHERVGCNMCALWCSGAVYRAGSCL